jgi:hypothetical protein
MSTEFSMKIGNSKNRLGTVGFIYLNKLGSVKQVLIFDVYLN